MNIDWELSVSYTGDFTDEDFVAICERHGLIWGGSGQGWSSRDLHFNTEEFINAEAALLELRSIYDPEQVSFNLEAWDDDDENPEGSLEFDVETGEITGKVIF